MTDPDIHSGDLLCKFYMLFLNRHNYSKKPHKRPAKQSRTPNKLRKKQSAEKKKSKTPVRSRKKKQPAKKVTAHKYKPN